MAKSTYQFTSDIIVCGERALTNCSDASIPMVSGDYCQYDASALTLDLYPNLGNYAQTIYTTVGLINALVANGTLTGVTGLPAGYPTPIA